jgi:hypothetical protein
LASLDGNFDCRSDLTAHFLFPKFSSITLQKRLCDRFESEDAMTQNPWSISNAQPRYNSSCSFGLFRSEFRPLAK